MTVEVAVLTVGAVRAVFELRHDNANLPAKVAGTVAPLTRFGQLVGAAPMDVGSKGSSYGRRASLGHEGGGDTGQNVARACCGEQWSP